MPGPMSDALMKMGSAPGGPYSPEELAKRREERIAELARRLPVLDALKPQLARWLMDNSTQVIQLIKHGDDRKATKEGGERDE